jgi:hypothetical protein
MLNSVRVRLTLWYAAVLACVLVTLAITTYFVLRQNSSHRTDTAIAEMAESFLTTVNAEAKDAAAPDGLKTAIDEAISEHKYRDTVFVVFDGESRIIASSDHQLLQGEPSAAVVKILQEAVGRDERRYHSFRTVRRCWFCSRCIASENSWKVCPQLLQSSSRWRFSSPAEPAIF